jgi:hypothetical protein
MIASILIIGISLALFVYWFRYTCLLILSAKTTRDYAGEVAAANQLGFLEVQKCLRVENLALEELRRALDRDYSVLTYLLSNTAQAEFGGDTLEQQMLKADYQIMRIWYAFTRAVLPRQARHALEEMSLVVAHFANAMGERSAVAAEV